MKNTRNQSSDHAEMGKRVLALIVARGGSKGLPRKNILSAGGKPLIAWTISAALDSKFISDVVLSSDDDEIIETARKWGCNIPFRRPPELATDDTPSIEVVLHALDNLKGYDYLILLQPTSPLRTSDDIDAAFALLQSKDAPSCVSVCEVVQSPYWMYRLGDDGVLERIIPLPRDFTRRQDLPLAHLLNGAIYIARIDWLRETKNFLADGCIGYSMPPERSIDIDNAEDFQAFCDMVEKKN
jgi:N-acylneuraminate cytidylyltransferase